VVVDPAVLPVVVPFVDESVVVPPMPFCAESRKMCLEICGVRSNQFGSSSVPLVFSAVEPAKPFA